MKVNKEHKISKVCRADELQQFKNYIIFIGKQAYATDSHCYVRIPLHQLFIGSEEEKNALEQDCVLDGLCINADAFGELCRISEFTYNVEAKCFEYWPKPYKKVQYFLVPHFKKREEISDDEALRVKLINEQKVIVRPDFETYEKDAMKVESVATATIGLNPNTLDRLAAAMGAETVKAEFHGPRAIVISDNGSTLNESYGLVMPVYVSKY